MTKNKAYKVGSVALIGRPNAGKSTLLNNLIGQKVSIVSPKPQTTQSRITAVYEDPTGQIFFKDTPGLFASSLGIKHTKSIIRDTIASSNAILYVVDHSRKFGREEEELIRLISESEKPFMLVLNKMDIDDPAYDALYRERLQSQAKAIIEASALKGKGMKAITAALFSLLPEDTRDSSVDDSVSPLLSQHSEEFLEEMVREKVFLLTKQEVPYQVTPHITSIINNDIRNILKVKGTIEVSEERYKPIIIGKAGSKIKEICQAVRQELEITTGKKVYVELQVRS